MTREPDGELLSTHTHFFRGRDELEAAVAVLAERAAAGRVPRLLSAGCSTGAEPYTLAILCAERAVGAAIHATDLNAEALAVARAARYPEIALRCVPEELLGRCFERRGGEHVLRPEIARRVTFARGDLRADPLPSPAAEDGPGWDVIVCRNVLIYYGPDTAGAIVTRLAGALRPDGVLILGSADALSFRPIEALELAGTGALAAYVRAGSRPRSAGERAPARGPGLVEPAPARVEAAAAPAGDVESVAAPARDFADALTIACRRLAEHAWDEAEAALLRAEQAAPLAPEPPLYLGVLRRKQGRFDEAFTHLRRAAFLAPDCWMASYLLAGAWEHRGDRARARLELLRALGALERGGGARLPAGAEVAGVAFDPALVAHACRQRLGR